MLGKWEGSITFKKTCAIWQKIEIEKRVRIKTENVNYDENRKSKYLL